MFNSILSSPLLHHLFLGLYQLIYMNFNQKLWFFCPKSFKVCILLSLRKDHQLEKKNIRLLLKKGRILTKKKISIFFYLKLNLHLRIFLTKTSIHLNILNILARHQFQYISMYLPQVIYLLFNIVHSQLFNHPYVLEKSKFLWFFPNIHF